MNKRAGLLAGGLLTLAVTSFAAESRTYQVTGPVIDTTADSITVQKGKEKWEISKTADTKAMGDVKKGDKVTIMYRMTATSIEAAPASKAAKH